MENLRNCNHDLPWLQKEIVSQGFNKFEEIFLATLDNENNLSIYENNNMKNQHDFFE